MKKSYVSPQLAVEDFVLEGHIAATCTKSQGANSGDPNTCSLDDGTGFTIFASGNCMNVLTGVDGLYTGAGGIQICYHGPTDAYGIAFGS